MSASRAFHATGVGVVVVGWIAAWASRDGRPTGLLLALWLALGALAAAGLIAAEASRRQGGGPRRTLAFVLLTSALAQAPLVVAPLALSDDAWRYLHDGRVALAGIDPWRHAPADAALDDIAGPERARVNHADVPTAYPPGAVAVFALVVGLGGGLVLLKALLVAAGLALVAVVAWALPQEARGRAAFVAWHPLVVLEVAGSGHVDVLGVLTMTAGLAVLVRGRRSLGAGLLALGAGLKLLPGVLALPLARRLGPVRALVLGTAAVLLALPALLPRAGVGGERGLVTYARHWEFNAPVYPVVRQVVERVRLKEGLDVLLADTAACGLTGPEVTSRAVLLALLGVVLLLAARRLAAAPPGDATATWEAASCAVAAVVLLSPTLHPWYLTWVLPFAALRPGPAWTWLTASAGVSYATALAAGGGPWQELAWPRFVEFVPFVLLLLRSGARRWR